MDYYTIYRIETSGGLIGIYNNEFEDIECIIVNINTVIYSTKQLNYRQTNILANYIIFRRIYFNINVNIVRNSVDHKVVR